MPYLEQALELNPGESLAIAIPSSEQHSAKNAWYRSLIFLGLSQEFTLSMRPEANHMLIYRKGPTILAPFESTVIKPKQDKTPLSKALLSGIQLTPSQQTIVASIQDDVDLGADWSYILNYWGKEPATRAWLERNGQALVTWPTREQIEANQATYLKKYPNARFDFSIQDEEEIAWPDITLEDVTKGEDNDTGE